MSEAVCRGIAGAGGLQVGRRLHRDERAGRVPPLELPAPLSPASLPPIAAPAPVTPSAPVTPIAPQPLPPMGGISPLVPPAAQVAASQPPATGTGLMGSAVQGYPVNAPTAPVQGYPVNSGPIATASMVSPAPGPPRLHEADFLRGGIPQVKVVAIVGAGNLITEQEVTEAVRQHLFDYRDLPTLERSKKEKELYWEELRALIERELLIDDMLSRLKKNKAPTDDIKEEAGKMAEDTIRNMRKERGLRTEAEFVEMLSAQGLTLPVFRRALERQMMSQQYVYSIMKETGKQRTPGFAEVRAYYSEHAEEFKVEDRVRWQDLFISYNKYPRREDARARAEQALQLARAGADFVALIKTEEGNPKGRQSWDGIGTRWQNIPADVAPTVFALRPGQIGGLVETQAGLHIVKVLEREYAGVRPLDEKVQQECISKIKRQLNEREYKKLIEGLWRMGSVQVFASE